MYVIKRNSSLEKVNTDKIVNRLKKLSNNLSDVNGIDFNHLALKASNYIIPNIKTEEIDSVLSDICAAKIVDHYDYNQLAANLVVSNLHKQTSSSFFEVTETCYKAGLFNDTYYSIVKKNKDYLENIIDYSRDYSYDYFGIITLKKKYLCSIYKKVVERPQHLLLRVAVSIHAEDLAKVEESYYYMSRGFFTHASPTLFSAGMIKQQLSSCFVTQIKEDSIEGIFDTMKDCALISKNGGGIGLYAGNIRAEGSFIKGTNGYSNGLPPMLKVFNQISLFVDQGGNKRPGSIAVYIDVWHADIFAFLQLKNQIGDDRQRAKDLFYGLMIPDLFMKRLLNNETWSLFSPDECPGLCKSYGKKFEELYEKYENDKTKVRKVVKAKELCGEIIRSQMETGTPYIIFKDAVNEKSNHKHLGTILASNLCTEIMQFFSDKETAVCNLASLALNRFLDKNNQFDFDLFGKVIQIIVKNLNNCIDINSYPISSAEYSNKKHRPIGIGVQGMADLFFLKGICFDSVEAKQLNKQIFECLYYNALYASNKLAEKYGAYTSFDESPISEGLFQFNLWGLKDSTNYPWESLRRDIKKFGLRNSLLVSPMPTAGTSQILGNYESFEPVTNNIFTRSTITGQYQIVNKYLIKDLIHKNLWNEEMKNTIILHKGSIQKIENIDEETKMLYRTVWEYKQKTLIDLAADRGPFIDQSQSLSIYMNNPTHAKMYTMFIYSWKKGLKTGLYYLRGKSAANPIQFTVVKPTMTCKKEGKQEDDEKTCLSCSA